jgi:hypothetical protein
MVECRASNSLFGNGKALLPLAGAFDFISVSIQESIHFWPSLFLTNLRLGAIITIYASLGSFS